MTGAANTFGRATTRMERAANKMNTAAIRMEAASARMMAAGGIAAAGGTGMGIGGLAAAGAAGRLAGIGRPGPLRPSALSGAALIKRPPSLPVKTRPFYPVGPFPYGWKRPSIGWGKVDPDTFKRLRGWGADYDEGYAAMPRWMANFGRRSKDVLSGEAETMYFSPRKGAPRTYQYLKRHSAEWIAKYGPGQPGVFAPERIGPAGYRAGTAIRGAFGKEMLPTGVPGEFKPAPTGKLRAGRGFPGGVMGGVLAGAAVAYGGIRFTGSAMKIAGEAEIAQAKLAAGLANVSDNAKEAQKSLTDLAEKQQRLTGVSSDYITDAQAMLTTFILNEEQISKLTPALVDMSVAMTKAGKEGGDLQSVAIAVGKAYATGLGVLTRYGITVDDATKAQFKLADSTEKVNLLVKILDKNFKGAAKAVGVTWPGKVNIAKQAIADWMQKIGEMITKNEVLMGIIDKVAEIFDSSTESMKDSFLSFSLAIADTGIVIIRILNEVAKAFQLVGFGYLKYKAIGISLFGEQPEAAIKSKEINTLITALLSGKPKKEFKYTASRYLESKLKKEEGVEIGGLWDISTREELFKHPQFKKLLKIQKRYNESLRKSADYLDDVQQSVIDAKQKWAEMSNEMDKFVNELKQLRQDMAAGIIKPRKVRPGFVPTEEKIPGVPGWKPKWRIPPEKLDIFGLDFGAEMTKIKITRGDTFLDRESSKAREKRWFLERERQRQQDDAARRAFGMAQQKQARNLAYGALAQEAGALGRGDPLGKSIPALLPALGGLLSNYPVIGTIAGALLGGILEKMMTKKRQDPSWIQKVEVVNWDQLAAMLKVSEAFFLRATSLGSDALYNRVKQQQVGLV